MVGSDYTGWRRTFRVLGCDSIVVSIYMCWGVYTNRFVVRSVTTGAIVTFAAVVYSLLSLHTIG